MKLPKLKFTLNVFLSFVLLLSISLSVVKLAFAVAPNPGHTWSEIGDVAVDLTSQVTGNLPVTRLNSGTGAATNMFWEGNATWSTVPGTLINRQTLTTSGTYTPTAGTTAILVRMVGGGGGGAGGTGVSSGCDGSGGGGGGAYAEKYFPTISGTYSYTIGSAGTAGATNGSGGAGGSTIFTGPTTITAPGGTGSTYTVGIAGVSVRLGGAGGAIPTNGDVNVGGQPGEMGLCTSGTVGISGNGAASQFGGGGIGKTGSAAAGVAGVGYGSGGSGGFSLSTTGQAGGAGTAGVIVVWEFH